jgi:membrane-associated phospholipid phosphatase
MRLAACLVVLVFALPARAAERLEAETAVDVPLVVAAAAIYAGLGLGVNRQVVHDDPPAARPGGIDGLAPLRLDRDYARASDWLFGAAVAGAGLAAGWDGSADDELGHRVLLLAETLALAGAVNETYKHAVRRPRPYTYEERKGKVDDDLSFFSGHTTGVAAASVFTARSLDLTGHLTAGERVAAYGGAALLTAAVGTLRVAAGKHFPSDVLVGAAVGGAIGWLVPELHRSGAVAAGGTGKNGVGLTFTLAI